MYTGMGKIFVIQETSPAPWPQHTALFSGARAGADMVSGPLEWAPESLAAPTDLGTARTGNHKEKLWMPNPWQCPESG